MTNVISLSEERKKRGLDVPKEVPVLDKGWDEPDDEPVMDKPLCWGPDYDRTQMLLTRYFAERQRDHGDETDE